MDEYIAKIPDLSEKALKFKGEKLSDEVRTELSSLLGRPVGQHVRVDMNFCMVFLIANN